MYCDGPVYYTFMVQRKEMDHTTVHLLVQCKVMDHTFMVQCIVMVHSTLHLLYIVQGLYSQTWNLEQT